MGTASPASRFAFDQPARYRINVQGRIPAQWCDSLEGMIITEGSANAAVQVTTLLGDLRDQAALFGVLDTLYELHLPIQSVERLGA